MTPQILTSDEQPDFLSEEAQNASRLDLMVVRAENKILDRYREVRPDEQVADYFGESIEGPTVQLHGWLEEEQDNPDLDAMEDELVFALRDATARIVEFWVSKPDQHVESRSQGARSASFRDKDLPSSVYAPLRPYDEREGWQ